MSRNFEFRVAPQSGQRAGRYSVEDATTIGAPVVVDGVTPDADGGLPLVAASAGAAVPAPGQGGILVYEELFTNGPLEVPSDVTEAPAGSKVQLVSGSEVKVLFRNTEGLEIVDVTGVDVGEGLSPAAGGTWAHSDEDPAWLTVTSVDDSVSGSEVVEARFTF